MAINDELLSFVKEALAHGTPRNAIKDTLLEAGWRVDQVEGALAAYEEKDC